MKFSLAGIIAFTASATAFAPSSMVRYDFVILSFVSNARAHTSLSVPASEQNCGRFQ